MDYSIQNAWQPEAFIKKRQEQKLQIMLLHLQQYSRFYQQLFANNNVDVHAIKCIEDLKNIPTTTKED